MPTPDDYYDPGSRPPQPLPGATPGTLITNGGIPGVTANRAQGTATPFARQLVATGVNPPNAATTEPTFAPGVTPGGGQPPTPADVKPPADPTPPLGAWTPDQISPWLHPHIQPVRGPVPNREPDSWVGSRPVWNPRPGEQGGGGTRLPPGQAYTFPQMLALAQHVGFQGQAAYTAAAIGMAESSGSPGVIHYNDGGKGYNSYGLMQINGVNDQTLAGLGGARAALDPETGMKAAYILSKGGSDFSPWSTFNDGAYRNYLDLNARPQESGVQLAGPPQQYIPSQGREPSQWGEPPETDWRPGRMPQSHDIPNILGGLLPLILAGAMGGGGMGMLAAFSGYQTARNKGQTEAARDAKNYWKDALEENTSRLKLQMIGAKGILAEYGGLDSPQAKEALLDLALKTDDHQLATAIQGGDMKKVGDLLNTRDKIFQDLSKTKDSQDRADRQEADKEQLNKDVNAGLGVQTPPVREPGGGVEPAQRPFFPGSGGGAPAPTTAPAPTGGGGGPAAGVPQPGEDGTPRPAAAPPSSAESPSPGEPPPQAPAAAPPAGGEPQATLPDVAVSAPQNDPLSRLTPQEQAIARDVLAGGEMPKFPPQAAASETRIEAAVAGLNQQLQRVGDNPNLKDERSVIGAVRGVDPLTADNLAAIAHNQLPLPGSETGTSGSGGSRGVLGYRNLMSTLARKVNPQWDPGQWGGIEKFRDPQGQTQRAIGRITAIGDAGTKLQEDLKRIPDNPTQLQRQLDQFVKQGFTDDPAYSNLFTDWQTFIIDSNALTQGGQGLEGETEQMIKSIPMYGQKSAYEGALKRHASFALSRYQQYQNQWSQLQRTDAMFGHNDQAEKQITDLANIKEGGTGGMPRVGPGGEGYGDVPKGGQYIGPDGKTYTKG